MSTLVTYDSSSEGDEPVVTQRKSAEAQSSTQDVAVTHARPKSPTPSHEVPIIGPTIPNDLTQNYDIYDNDTLSQAPDNERDLLRHLTRPTHPMTAMPPSPPGTPNSSTTSRFKHFLSLKPKGVHFNEDLAHKGAFRNPAMLQALMGRAGLDSEGAYRTSLPLDVFDVGNFPDIAYKEALLKSQQDIHARDDIEKKALATSGKHIIGFTSGGVSGPSSATSSPSGLHKRQKR